MSELESENLVNPYQVTVLTMFPEAFPGPLGVSLIGTAWKESALGLGNTGHSQLFER